MTRCEMLRVSVKLSSWILQRKCICESPNERRINSRRSIKERAAPFGAWPAKMTMLLYRMNDTREIVVSPGKSSKEEEFRITVMWIATQMQHEFDLRQ
jgi:hypothetical protein